MAIVACKECGGKVSSKAAKCPHCGAPMRKSTTGCLPVVGVLGLIVFLIAVANDVAKQRGRQQSVAAQTPAPPRQQSKPEPAQPKPHPQPPPLKAAIHDLRCSVNSLDMMEAIGEVQNNSQAKLDSVWVLIGFYNSRGQLVDSNDSAAKIRPLLPFQRSPFTVYGPTNPEVKTCQVLAVRAGPFGPQIPFDVVTAPPPEPSTRTYQDPMKYYKCPDKEGTIVVQDRPCN